MLNILHLIKDNYQHIILISIIFLGLLVIFSILNGNSREKKNKENKENSSGKLITIESMDTNKSFSATFCNNHKNPHQTHNDCNTFKNNEEGCNLSNCCVWASFHKGKPQCVGGDHHGPTFHASENSPKLKKYSFRGKVFNVHQHNNNISKNDKNNIDHKIHISKNHTDDKNDKNKIE